MISETTIRRDRLKTLLTDAFREYEDNQNAPYDPKNPDTHKGSSEFPVFRLTYDLMRAASLELAGTLRPRTLTPDTESSYNPNNRTDFNYYFSDSVYDELSNPGMIISDCVDLISVFYETTVTDAQIDTMIENLDYILAYDLLDDNPENADRIDWTTVNDIHLHLRSQLDEIDPPKGN